ncbi:hypothetical protein BRADI_4g04947v3 [Brachypodium distachyon]|uniref:Uncharacterized protein n=1 Tax=Brachypodium distachyon TaxID=15368 RepID=A0A2K2CKK6_BRADI|nr:hypothetical protein BRADI_4g04947v3 [Brachypodium distachyon]PNT62557.1 hypothetical protein BRADI_4g04947v3 [Brachypodium distachyon]PNT62558.1 hypothetical protein BRADI_4g04947v3 [Brachypodium distachyon]
MAGRVDGGIGSDGPEVRGSAWRRAGSVLGERRWLGRSGFGFGECEMRRAADSGGAMDRGFSVGSKSRRLGAPACAAPLPSACLPGERPPPLPERTRGCEPPTLLTAHPCCFAAAAASPVPQTPARATFRRRPATNLCLTPPPPSHTAWRIQVHSNWYFLMSWLKLGINLDQDDAGTP